MTTVAFYRARVIVVRYLAIVAAILILGLIFALRSIHHTQTDVPLTAVPIPLPFMVYIAGFGGLIVASITCSNLSRERSLLALAWTRPEQRNLAALRMIAVDALTIVVVDVVVAALIALAVTIFGDAGGFNFNGTSLPWSFTDAGGIPSSFAEILGATFMWYGLIAAATSWSTKAAIAWAAWPIFIAIGGIAGTHALAPLGLDPVIQFLAFFDPLTYLQTQTHGNADTLPVHTFAVTAGSWIIAAVACALAVYGWSRKEFSR
jgi:hypothetical protein